MNLVKLIDVLFNELNIWAKYHLPVFIIKHMMEMTVIHGCLLATCSTWGYMKINEQHFKISSLQISEPVSTKFGTNYPWIKRIQIPFNKGPQLF